MPDGLPRPRLLASDIDGTLLDPRGQLRPAVREAVSAIAGSGVHRDRAPGARDQSSREDGILDASRWFFRDLDDRLGWSDVASGLRRLS